MLDLEFESYEKEKITKEKDFTQHKLTKRTFFDGKELIVRKETSVFDVYFVIF